MSDLSHHFSEVTKRRGPSIVKQIYQYFHIPGIGNLAAGMPNSTLFPFDTLEAQTAPPDRWQPTPNHHVPDSQQPPASRQLGAVQLSSSGATPAFLPACHITVPATSTEQNLARRIDVETALQYGTALGYPPLYSFVRQFTRRHLHSSVPYIGGPEVVLTCGSTNGFANVLDLLTNVWRPSDPPADRPHLLCEEFVYRNILDQALPRGILPAPVKIDEQGMCATGSEGLEDVLANWDTSRGQRPRLLYTVTMGHNPTGGVLSVSRRREIYAICSQYDVIIVEDDPYWYLQYPSAAHAEASSRGLPQPSTARQPLETVWSSGYAFLESLTPSFINIDTDGRVIRLDTFSKTVAPGCRMGWITAQPAFIEKLLRISETTTQQPSGFAQGLVAELIVGQQPAETLLQFDSIPPREQLRFAGWSMDGWVRWLEGLRGQYERRMNQVCRLLDEGAFVVDGSGSPNDCVSPNACPEEPGWTTVTRCRLMSFDWPRGGMFVWIRVHFEAHPLWGVRSDHHGVLEGPSLSLALFLFLTHVPHRVLVVPGSLFAATDAISSARGWAFVRLAFAGEAEDRLGDCTARFVGGLHAFWRITEPLLIEELLSEYGLGQWRQ